MMRNNMSGGVWALQRALVHCYQQNIAIDGEFGPLTQAALRRAQERMGADPDGGYGPQTRNLMLFSSNTVPITCWRAGTVGWPR
jgi:peptidoglycan hydrolase-like protein with peptidoglycan-binding domain